MNRVLGTVCFFVSLLVLFSCQSGPEPNPHTDWADVTLYATGIGPIRQWSEEARIRGVQQAKADAASQLTAKILALRADADEPLSVKAHKDEQMRKRIAAFVRGADVIAIENRADGVTVQTRLFLGGHFKATLGLLKRKVISGPQRPQEDSF